MTVLPLHHYQLALHEHVLHLHPKVQEDESIIHLCSLFALDGWWANVDSTVGFEFGGQRQLSVSDDSHWRR